MKLLAEPRDRSGPHAARGTLGGIYLGLGVALLAWTLAPAATRHTVLVDTPQRVAETVRLLAQAATRAQPHPSSWRVRPYPLVHHGVIHADPAMLGLERPREIGLILQPGARHRFGDATEAHRLIATAPTTYVLDPGADVPWHTPLAVFDHRKPVGRSPAELGALAAPGHHLLIVMTDTAAVLGSPELLGWLARHGVDPAILRGPSRPALAILPPASATPRVPWVVAPPRGLAFRF